MTVARVARLNPPPQVPNRKGPLALGPGGWDRKLVAEDTARQKKGWIPLEWHPAYLNSSG